MGKNNIVSGILVSIVILMIVASTFLVVNYTTGVLNAAVAFASTDQIAQLQGCGVTAPTELIKLRNDIPSFLLPVIYAGFPGLLVILSILMFIAGHYYSNAGEVRSSSETTTTTSSPNRSASGKYKPGRHVQKTQTHKSSERGGN